MCLWKTVAETRVRRVSFIQMIHRAVVFEGGAKDVALAAVLGEGLAPAGLVMDKRFHSDGHKGCGVVVVDPVDVGVG